MDLNKTIDATLNIANKVKYILFVAIAISLSPLWLPIYSAGWVYDFFDKAIKSWWIKIFISIASIFVVIYLFHFIFPEWSSGVLSLFSFEGEESCLEPMVC